jgi:fluoride exporter
MIRFLAVALGGAIGSSLRYGAGLLAHRQWPSSFPYPTALVNVTGCFAIGLLAVLSDERGWFGPTPRLFLLVGILGGYTTFSSFGYETLALVGRGDFGWALVNALGQVALGLVAVWAGMALGRVF